MPVSLDEPKCRSDAVPGSAPKELPASVRLVPVAALMVTGPALPVVMALARVPDTLERSVVPLPASVTAPVPSAPVSAMDTVPALMVVPPE